MGALGLLGMLIPEQWGGIGMSTVGFVAAMEQIGLADQSVAAAWQAHVTIGSLPLYLFGSDAQRERWLRPLAEGRALGAFGLTEPDAGSDARGIRTRAVPRDGGWLINGAQDVHLQRGHRHVVRRHACSPAPRRPKASRPPTRASSWRRTRPASRWDRRCAASAGAASTRVSCTSTTCGWPTTTSSAIRRWGSASSCARSRSAASRSRRCRSASPRPCSTSRPTTRASASSSASPSRSSKRCSSSSPTSQPSSKPRAG